MRVYEIFLKRDGREEFRHAGSLEAATPELALVLARENYSRRAEGDAMWIVDRQQIVVAEPGFIAPNADKPHRHNDGRVIAEHRKSHRESS